jgi:low affinity Fe/Cu permease
MKNTEDPLIRINWNRIWRIIKGAVLDLIKAVKRIIELILILILKFLTKIVLFMLWLYKSLKAFSKRNIKGFWLLLFIVLFSLFFLVFAHAQFRDQSRLGGELQNQLKINNQQNEDIKIKDTENQELKDQIEELNNKLEAKSAEQARYARQEWILANRDSAEKNLPTEVKGLVTKYASVYGVEDTRLMNCIIYFESGGRDEAVGDNGAARGVCQYHLGTFLGHRRQMGLSQEDLRTDTESSIQAMLFSVSRGGIGNWTARTKCM